MNWYPTKGAMGQGLIADEDTGRNVAVAYDEKDAPLLAAAPMMLAALEAIHQGFLDGSIKFSKNRQSDKDPYHPANTKMSAAMAQARGDD